MNPPTEKERRIEKLDRLAEDQAGLPEGDAARRKADELRASMESREEETLEAPPPEPQPRQRPRQRSRRPERVRGPRPWFYSFARWKRMLARAREEGRTLVVRWRSPYPYPKGSVSKWKAVERVMCAPHGVLLGLRDYGSNSNRRVQRISSLDKPSRFVPEAVLLPLDDPRRMFRNPSWRWPNPNGGHGDPPEWTGPPSRPHWIPLDEWLEAVENMTSRELHDFIRRSWWRWVYVGRYETSDPGQGRLFREPDAGDNGDED